MKILILDIETRPNLAYVWGLWNQNIGINQIVDTGRVISLAWKWHGQKKTHFASDYHDGHEQMIQKAWDAVDQADAVVHFNGISFDMKHLQREFLLEQLPPPSPYQNIDLLSTVKKQFKFPSNKLQHVATAIGLGSKVQHDGFDLWVACMNNEEKAWATMRRYNMQDVVLTEQLYDTLLPWVTRHPNANVYNHTNKACPKCGGYNHQRRGYRSTATAQYVQLQCNDCKSYFRERRKTDTEVKYV